METRHSQRWRFGVLSLALCWLGTAFTGGWHGQTRELVRRKAEKVAFGVNREHCYLADGDDIRKEYLDCLGTGGIQLKNCSKDSEILEKVSLGDLGQFFCKSKDHMFWNIIDPDLNKLCREENVKFLSFGSGKATILATTEGEFYFHNISKQLQETITGSKRSPVPIWLLPLKTASFWERVHEAESFILFEDGGWTYHGIADVVCLALICMHGTSEPKKDRVYASTVIIDPSGDSRMQQVMIFGEILLRVVICICIAAYCMSWFMMLILLAFGLLFIDHLLLSGGSVVWFIQLMLVIGWRDEFIVW